MAKLTPPNKATYVYRSPDKEFECGIHELTYRAARAGCPACAAERTASEVQNALKKTKGELEHLYNENHRLKIQIDITYAIREAIEILDDSDREFLKSILYQWRDEKSVGLKTTHGGIKGRKNTTPNGFIAVPRKGDPYGHLCSSLGGLAIAEYFEEATNSVGPAKAMEMLVRGMAQLLPGAIT